MRYIKVFLKKKYKLIIKVIFIMLFISSLTIITNKEINGSEEKKVYIIADNLSYKKGEEAKITINLNDYQSVKEIKININNINVITPITIKDEYFQKTSMSCFTNIIVNEKTINGLRYYAINNKNNTSNYLNNICELSFMVNEDIDNIIEILTDNILVYLFNEFGKIIDNNLIYDEKIKIEWLVKEYTIEVYDEKPKYQDDIKILNRTIDEFDFIINDNIDNTKLGVQIISLIIFDKRCYDYVLLSKTVSIKDFTSPKVEYEENMIINDYEVDSFMIEDYLTIIDNYDLNPKINITYLNQEKEILSSYSEFITYIRSNINANISFYIEDESQNRTDVKKINLSIIDTTPPIISANYENNIVIKDTLITEFNILDYFQIEDNYDEEPLFIYHITNNKTKEEVEDIIDSLNKGEELLLSYFSRDNNGNESEIKNTIIKVIDETAPIIIGVRDYVINDTNISSTKFEEDINCKDNIDLHPKLIINYYIYNKEGGVVGLSSEDFKIALKKGNFGYVEYSAVDNSMNYSEKIKQKITIRDTTLPVIEIKYIKDNGKYLKIEEIMYEVTDNFEGEIDVYTVINDYPYNNTPITEIGEYTLVITATDLAGNISKKEISFSIIENNIMGCGNDIDCFIENYKTITIIVIILIISIICIFVIKIIFLTNKKKKKYHSEK